jgi:hypothetical protein
MSTERSELQQAVIDALIENRAFDFSVIGATLGEFGERAARSGTELGFHIGRRVLNYCIPPEPFLTDLVAQRTVDQHI